VEQLIPVVVRRVVLASLLALAILAAVVQPPAHASYPPRNCGVMSVHKHSYRVKTHFLACRHARHWSRLILAGRRGPPGWKCRRFSRKVTRIAFICQRGGGREFYAIRR
jgi:hypothetical protein